jgi:hypothetical protein
VSFICEAAKLSFPDLLWVVMALPVCIAPLAQQNTHPVEQRAAKLGAVELRAKILAAQDKVTSILISYRSKGGSYVDPKFPPGTYLVRRVAAKRPSFFYHLSAHGYDGRAWEDDPEMQECFVTATKWLNAHPFNRIYTEGELRPDGDLPGSLPGELFILATGLWPCATRSPPRSPTHPFALYEVARSSAYTVRRQQEAVNGRWCHVLENPAGDRLWIDVDRGCCVVAREVKGEADSSLVNRVELGGHVEKAPGIWLPAWIHNIDQKVVDGNGIHRKELKNNLIEVIDSRANDIDDSFFEARLPPGSLRLGTGGPAQVYPDGLDHLDNIAAWIEKHGPGRASSDNHDHPFITMAIAIPLLFIAEAALFWTSRSLRRRRTVVATECKVPGNASN